MPFPSRTALLLLPGVLRVEMSTQPFVKRFSPALPTLPFMPTNITVVKFSFINSFPFKKKKKTVL